MTVGIAFSHDKRLEAIVVTDSRASGMSRQSDSANKVGEFSSDGYHGVIFGTGNGTVIEGAIKNLDSLKATDLSVYMDDINALCLGIQNRTDVPYLAALKKEIEKKASIYNLDVESMQQTALSLPQEQRESYVQHKIRTSLERREQFVEQELSKALSQYDQSKAQTGAQFIAVSFDKTQNKIRTFYLSSVIMELFIDHIEIGSGQDGSNIYFAANLQGIGHKAELDTASLVFHAVNAYSNSTINQGVGGTPRILRVTRDGVESLPREQVVTLINLSGAYLAGFNEEKLTHRGTEQLVRDVLAKKSTDIAAALDLNENALRSRMIPYSSWKECINSKFYS
jgi:hypothetical protein